MSRHRTSSSNLRKRVRDGAFTGNLAIANSYVFGCSVPSLPDEDSTAVDVAFTILTGTASLAANIVKLTWCVWLYANEAVFDFASQQDVALVVRKFRDDFEDVDFVGAVGADDWTANWTCGREDWFGVI